MKGLRRAHYAASRFGLARTEPTLGEVWSNFVCRGCDARSPLSRGVVPARHLAQLAGWVRGPGSLGWLCPRCATREVA